MKATVVKKYELSNEDTQALERAKEILNELCVQGFEDDFYENENVYLENTIGSIEAVLENDGEDWIKWKRKE